MSQDDNDIDVVRGDYDIDVVQGDNDIDVVQDDNDIDVVQDDNIIDESQGNNEVKKELGVPHMKFTKITSVSATDDIISAIVIQHNRSKSTRDSIPNIMPKTTT